jgi:hypothetical protein
MSIESDFQTHRARRKADTCPRALTLQISRTIHLLTVRDSDASDINHLASG